MMYCTFYCKAQKVEELSRQESAVDVENRLTKVAMSFNTSSLNFTENVQGKRCVQQLSVYLRLFFRDALVHNSLFGRITRLVYF